MLDSNYTYSFSFAQSWNINGNSNATATSFLGTTTDIDLVFKRNGVNAGRVSSTTNNTSYGLNSLNLNSSGTSNTANGSYSLFNNSTGSSNTAFGSQSLQYNTTGIWNTGVARNALQNTTTGNYNTALGVNALTYNNTGNSNFAGGMGAMQSNTTGNNNTASGVYALLGNTIGENNTAMGYYSNVSANNLANATAIGARAFVAQSNSLVLGSINGINGATASTNVGIGTTAPSAQLHTTGTVKFGGLVQNLTPVRLVVSDVDGNIAYKEASTFGSTADGSETKINAGSNVTLVGVGTIASPYIISASVPTIQAPQWITSSIGTNNIINTNAGSVIIGTSISTLPAGYKLYVQDGILAEKVKVALKSGANWADYVFEKGYKLKSLSEVETFVKKNKHLPNVQSAQDLVDNGGVDITQMLAKQMEKIEELTLYLFEMNRKIENLENENRNLKAKVTLITNHKKN